MNLVTRCPACATTFKVVKDQLRISEGWVRCGRCSEVFDATADLREVPESPATPPLAQEPEQAAVIDEVHEAATQPPPQAEAAVPPMAEADPEVGAQAQADPVPTAAAADAAAVQPAEDPAPSGPEPLRFIGIVADEPWVAAEPPVVPIPKPSYPPFPSIDLTLPSRGPLPRDPIPDADGPDSVQLQKALRRAREKAAKAARAAAREEKSAPRKAVSVMQMASEPELPMDGLAGRLAPSFHFAEAAPGFWRRPAAHRSLYAMAVLAGVLILALQAAHEWRDAIAARSPSWRPALSALCRLTGCEISGLRQKNDIVIEGASFSRAKSGDGYRLDFTLRNVADVPLAMPAVELSLRDMQERTVVRRVLMPVEFGAPATLPARAERAASLPITLVGAEAAALPPVAGFLVEAFYP